MRVIFSSIDPKHFDLMGKKGNATCQEAGFMSGCTAFSRLVPENSKESLFKSSALRRIDCQLRCVNQTSGSFRSVKQGMDFP